MPVAAINMELRKESVVDSGTFDILVGEVSSINGPTQETNVVDVTSHSTSDPYRRKFPTLLTMGKLSFTIFYNPDDSTHDAVTGLKADWRGRVVRDWQLLNPGGTTGTQCSGFVSQMSEAYPVDGVMTSNVTIDLTGPPTDIP